MFKIMFFLIFPILLFAKNDVKIVTATGLGQNENEALLQAKRNAVQQGLGTYITSETVIENFMLKYDKIKTSTKGFVTDYQVIKKRKTIDSLIEITIKAEVTLDEIWGNKQAIKILLESLGKPKIMVSVYETDPNNNQISPSITETEIENMLIENGFDIVDKQQIKEILDKEKYKLLAEGNEKEAKYIYSKTGAEIIITGYTKTNATKNELLKNMLSVHAIINLKAIDATSGKIFYSTSISSAIPYIDPVAGAQKAIKKCLKKEFINKFMVKLLDEFQNLQNNGREIVLNLKGINDFDLLISAKQILEKNSLLSNVTKKNWDRKLGLAELIATYNGKDIETLAAKLNNLSLNNNYIFKVDDFKANKITLSVERKK